MNTPDARTVHEIAEQLRNAAAWLRLAADRLEEGKLEDARNMTRLGAIIVEPLPHRVADMGQAAKV